jgi:hypothetical protein
VILPISAPGFVVTIIWQFTSSWNDFLFAIFLSNTRNGPITIALNALAGAQSPDYAASMAGALITSLPTLVVLRAAGPVVHRRPHGRLRQDLTPQARNTQFRTHRTVANACGTEYCAGWDGQVDHSGRSG